MKYPGILLLLLSALLLPARAELSVTARFDPPRVAIGDRAAYIVEIRETSTTAQLQVEAVNSLPIPNAGGLTLSNGRTSSSQQTRIFNGAAEYSVTQSLLIDAIAPRVGSYRIPEFTFTYKGQVLRAPAATLEAVERPADAPPPRDELVFLKADLPDELFVGQTIEFELQLFVSERVQLTGLNNFQRNTDGFIVGDLPERPEESTETINGERYRRLSWPLSLTPIQSGPQSLGFQFALSARLPESGDRRSRDPFGMSPFGRSLFDDVFGRTEQLNVYTDALSLNVLPLPERDRPAGFTGAIGNFALEVGVDAAEVRQGEPVMLSVQLNGQGNFSRINGPTYPPDPAWRIYDPEARFEPSDAPGLRGSKRFDYLLIPQQSGRLLVPETRFSYFDPVRKTFITLTAPAIPVEVTPGQPMAFSPSLPTPLPTGSGESFDPTLTRKLSPEEALLTLDYRPLPSRRMDGASWQHPGFIAANLAAASTLIAMGTLLHRSRKRREHPTYRIRQIAREGAKKAIAAARTAAAANEPEVFYREAGIAIRQKLTARTGQNLAAAGSTEITQALAASGLAPDKLRAIQTFLTAADAHRFGSQQAAPLRDAAADFESILNVL